MEGQPRDELEREIRRRLDRRDHAAAATLALRGYGAEIYGFLITFHRDEEDAAEVFSLFSERLWRDLPAFRGDCSFRTWAYALARHASLNHRRDTARRERRQRPLPADSEPSAIAAEIRSGTASYLRSSSRERFAALREALSVEDQTFLVLRVDRKLAWNDLARVLHDGAEPLAAGEVEREAARLRKRFQLLKERLRRLGQKAGVVSEGRGEE